MRRRFPVRFAAIAAAVFLAALVVGLRSTPSLALAPKSDEAVEPPDFSRGGKPAPEDGHDWTLGATGARGWIFAHRSDTRLARQIYVTKVAAGSPADGRLQPGDVILGIGKQPFSDDARIVLARALTEAERTENSGRLSLLRLRNGTQETVDLSLAVQGSYSPTAPYDCSKSARLLEDGCRALAKRLQSLDTKRRGNPIERSLNALALLASGRAEYLPLVREEARWAADFAIDDPQGFQSWWYGYVNLFLAEYALAVEDPIVLPGLKRLSLAIAQGQSSVGSWGHAFAMPDGRLRGYGAMNQPGLSLTMSLVLAKQAGVDDPAIDLAIERSRRFLSFYIGKGCIPYGDHHPWMETHEDNGKCAMGAVLFDLLQHREGAEFFSRMSTAAFGIERELGHTGNYFNIVWALPGVSRSGPNATGAWLREFSWYYDMARGWDGSYVYQGIPGMSVKKSVSDHKYEGWDMTGAYLLAYALPLRKLHITGKQPSVAPALSAEEAGRIVDDGRGWSVAGKRTTYDDRDAATLLAGLSSWSPIVRERSAQALARREGDVVPQLLQLLESRDSASRHGACQALSALKAKAAPAVAKLQSLLWDDDLWLRIKAAEALANIGQAARPAVADLLKVVTAPTPGDPRGMTQRYIAFCLFYSGNVLNVRGLLARSLDDVDRRALYPAVEAVLTNEDGRAREAVSSVYDHLAFEDVRPLLPAIHRAIVEPAPSGEMFADGIRLRGLELLAKYRIAEGVPLCTSLAEPERWGAGRRVEKCLAILSTYGTAAKPALPELRKLEANLRTGKQNRDDLVQAVQRTIAELEATTKTVEVRSLDTAIRTPAAGK